MKGTHIGDILEVRLSDDAKCYIQYIGNDIEQLNSDVIRCFKRRYPIATQPSVDEVLDDEVEFYAHVTGVGLGIKYGVWETYGPSTNIGNPREAFFRDHADPEEQRADGAWGWPKVSKTWNVWHLGSPRKLVKGLKGKDAQANPGIVFQPENVVKRIQFGEYKRFYPSYE